MRAIILAKPLGSARARDAPRRTDSRRARGRSERARPRARLREDRHRAASTSRPTSAGSTNGSPQGATARWNTCAGTAASARAPADARRRHRARDFRAHGLLAAAARATHAACSADSRRGYVARYALGRDYHKVLRTRLARLARAIEKRAGAHGFRAFVDSAPVLEKALARNAGFGWIGKHTNLIDREAGSWFLLGELYTSLPLPVDSPVGDHCGSCSACLDVCPTRAIVAPYQLDARRCISYLTIEQRGAIPLELRARDRQPDFRLRRLSAVLPVEQVRAADGSRRLLRAPRARRHRARASCSRGPNPNGASEPRAARCAARATKGGCATSRSRSATRRPTRTSSTLCAAATSIRPRSCASTCIGRSASMPGAPPTPFEICKEPSMFKARSHRYLVPFKGKFRIANCATAPAQGRRLGLEAREGGARGRRMAAETLRTRQPRDADHPPSARRGRQRRHDPARVRAHQSVRAARRVVQGSRPPSRSRTTSCGAPCRTCRRAVTSRCSIAAITRKCSSCACTRNSSTRSA